MFIKKSYVTGAVLVPQLKKFTPQKVLNELKKYIKQGGNQIGREMGFDSNNLKNCSVFHRVSSLLHASPTWQAFMCSQSPQSIIDFYLLYTKPYSGIMMFCGLRGNIFFRESRFYKQPRSNFSTELYHTSITQFFSSTSWCSCPNIYMFLV